MRVYHIPTESQCFANCDCCIEIGCYEGETRSLESILQSFEKAKSAEINKISFPFNTLFRSDFPQILEAITLHNLNFEVKVSSIFKNNKQLQIIEDKNIHYFHCCSGIQSLNKFNFSKITWVLNRGIDICNELSGVERDFLRKIGVKPSVNLNSHEYYNLTRNFYDIFSMHEYEHWNAEIINNLGLEILPEFQTLKSTTDNDFRISIIIPTFNSAEELIITLKHILQQKFSVKEFELIIIDDGSDKPIFPQLVDWARPYELNLKYMYLPRPIKRSLGDGNFRAGIARNLGVKEASSELICFLDSDIIIPEYFLEKLLEYLNTSDVVQVKRYNLKNYQLNTSYKNINKSTDIEWEDGDYWEKFNESKDWQTLKDYWKYTCTYGLALRKDLFKRAGWFNRTFVNYGFEDTDLGYRLYKLKARFFLAPIDCYHLTNSTDRSEYKKSQTLRRKTLALSANRFYRTHSDPYLFNIFASLINLHNNSNPKPIISPSFLLKISPICIPGCNHCFHNQCASKKFLELSQLDEILQNHRNIILPPSAKFHPEFELITQMIKQKSFYFKQLTFDSSVNLNQYESNLNNFSVYFIYFLYLFFNPINSYRSIVNIIVNFLFNKVLWRISLNINYLKILCMRVYGHLWKIKMPYHYIMEFLMGLKRKFLQGLS